MDKLVILISGKIGSGKNTVSDILKEELENHFHKIVRNEFFARALKEMCRDSFRPLTDFLNNIFKIVYDTHGNFGGIEFDKLITTDDSWFERKNPISRHILQIIGSDVVRKIDPDYWTKKTIENIINDNFELVTVSDMRFKNEMELVEGAFNTITIRVERNIERNNSFNEHISETALDDYKDWDIIIKNDGTLEELRQTIKELITKEHTYDYPGRNMFARFIK